MVKTKEIKENKEKAMDKKCAEAKEIKCVSGKKCGFVKFVLFVAIIGYGAAVINKDKLPEEFQKYIMNFDLSQNHSQNVQNLENQIGSLNEKIYNLENRLDNQNYENQLNQINQKLEVNTTLSQNLADNNQRLLKLNDEVKKYLEDTNFLKGEVKQVKVSAAPASVVLSMVNRIDSNEAKIKTLSKQSEDGALILMGTVLIKDAMERGETFYMEAQILKEIAKNSKDVQSEIKVIEEFANKKLSSKEYLVKEFEVIANDAVSISKLKDENDWKGKVYNKFKSLVKVRKTGLVAEEDMSFEAVLARAENYIEDGQIEKAVKEVEKTNQEKGILKNSGLDVWLVKAKDRVKIDNAISNILAKSLAVIKVAHIK